MAASLTSAYRKLHIKRLLADLGGGKNIRHIDASDNLLTVKVRTIEMVMPSGQFQYDGFESKQQIDSQTIQVTVAGSAKKVRRQVQLMRLSGRDGFDNYDEIPKHPQAQAAALIFESFGPQYNLKSLSCPDDQHLLVEIVDLSLVSPDHLFFDLDVGITKVQRAPKQVILTLPHAQAVRMLIYFYQ